MAQTSQIHVTGGLETPSKDPLADARETNGAQFAEFHGERMLQILRWRDVRKAASDTVNFDSGELGRVPIPPETGLRSFRQIPIETNAPEHSAWKELLQPFFRRPKEPLAKAEFEKLVIDQMSAALAKDETEIVSDFALPIQSMALAVLLDTDRTLADEWIGWGLHAFRTNGKTDPAKSDRFLTFIDRMLSSGKDCDQGLFSYLHDATFEDRSLTQDEKRGICHLALSGGRDTVINSLTGVIAHLAAAPSALRTLRDVPEAVPAATEEFFRFLSPLPQIGRVCPNGFEFGHLNLPKGQRAALCWASANRDSSVFDDPEQLRLDRKRNPHVAFGAGVHTCLGAPLARLLVSTLISEIATSVDRIEVTRSDPRHNDFGTPYLFNSIHVRFHARTEAQPSQRAIQ